MAFWHDLITQKSWEALIRLKTHYRFILIGGWAVFLYTKSLKSKDIDIVVDYDELGRFQKDFSLIKNERLKKYEARIEEIEIDIYTPHYSNPGLPAEKIVQESVTVEGFVVPKIEVLLLLKQHAYKERAGTPKGEKDKLDIISLLKASEIKWDFYKELVQKERPSAAKELWDLLGHLREVPELEINSHQMSKLKRQWKDGIF